jgi:hypothetical protein
LRMQGYRAISVNLNHQPTSLCPSTLVQVARDVQLNCLK